MVRRLGVLLVAYVAAAAAASVFLNLALPFAAAWPGPFPRLDAATFGKSVFLGWCLVASLGFAPALVLAGVAEWRAITRPAFFLAAGAAAALLVISLVDRQLGPAAGELDAVTTVVIAATGAVAGLVYWAIAGRRSRASASPA